MSPHRMGDPKASVPGAAGQVKCSREVHEARQDLCADAQRPEASVREPAPVGRRARIEEQASILPRAPGAVAVAEEDGVSSLDRPGGEEGRSRSPVPMNENQNMALDPETQSRRKAGAYLLGVVVAVNRSQRSERFEDVHQRQLGKIPQMNHQIGARECGQYLRRQLLSTARHVRVREDDRVSGHSALKSARTEMPLMMPWTRAGG
jgi:hypothetical protein